MPVALLNRQRRLPIDKARLTAAAEAILAAVARPQAELSVMLVSDARMRVFNRQYRGIDAPTDVLSFSQLEGEAGPQPEEVLGDVVLAVETAAAQGRERHQPGLGAEAALHAELVHLLLHGVLHLIGHTHAEEAEFAAMDARHSQILAELVAVGLVDGVAAPGDCERH